MAVPAEKAGHSPVVVASVGTYSGVAGNVFVPILQGAQVWVKYVNAKGGVNGHRVDLIVYDDGGDLARHRAQVQEAVEQRRVIAFLAQADSVTATSSLDYIKAKRVPVVGTDTGGEWPYEHPMYFLQAPSGTASEYSMIAAAAKLAIPVGKSKLGTLVCVESRSCNDGDRAFAAWAKPLGFKQVYRAKASIGQPDYTAECLAARNAAVEVLIIMFDQNSVRRLATSCARQAYDPLYVIPGQVALKDMADDANLDGALAPTNVFPWFGSGTPGTDEFQHAMQTYAKAPGGIGLALGWVAGKLFEKAAINLPEPPTSAGLLRGLWSIKNDTLGGLTQPLSFTEGQLSERLACWVTIVIQNKAWKSPDGMQQHCTPAAGF